MLSCLLSPATVTVKPCGRETGESVTITGRFNAQQAGPRSASVTAITQDQTPGKLVHELAEVLLRCLLPPKHRKLVLDQRVFDDREVGERVHGAAGRFRGGGSIGGRGTRSSEPIVHSSPTRAASNQG